MALSDFAQLRILLCTLPPFAVLVTYFRLYIRGTRGKLWWDDFWAFMSSLFAIFFVAVTMLHLNDPTTISQGAKIAIYYMVDQSFYATGWTARISIMFTVIRLAYGRLRSILFMISVVFFITWGVLFAQVIWVCEGQASWKLDPIPQCVLGKQVGIAQVIADVISDAILIGAPMKLLMRARLTPGLKVRLISVFATTGVTTLISLYHAIVLLRTGGIPEIVAAVIQISIGLLITNLGVVVAFVFNLKHESDSDDTTPVAVQTFGQMAFRKKQELSTFGFGTRTADISMNTMAVHVEIDKSHDWSGSVTAVNGKSQGTTSDTIMEDEIPYKVGRDV